MTLTIVSDLFLTDSFLIKGNVENKYTRLSQLLDESRRYFLKVRDATLVDLKTCERIQTPLLHINLDEILIAHEFLDEAGDTRPMVMGCYGIGITRIAAAAIEQNHDDAGIAWPMPLAPYQVLVLPLQMNDQACVDAAETLYRGLGERGIEVLLDDRNERPGSKFKDADLIGIPLRVAIGKRSLRDGNVEVKWRRESESFLVAVDEACARIAQLVSDAMTGATP